MRPAVAISMGDPSGVGPEITLKLIQTPEIAAACRPIIVGSKWCLAKAATVINAHDLIDAGGDLALPDGVSLVDLDNVVPADHVWGTVTAESGRAAAAYVAHAVELAVAGSAVAIVTAPLNKEALRLASINYSGHTEMIAAQTNATNYAMMLVAPNLRVIHVSTHVRLAEAVRLVHRDRILEVIMLANRVLQEEGLKQPRIAVAALNPHASEGGLFGPEENEIIAPAIHDAEYAGVNVSGPYPADTVFWKASQGKFDLVVAMYHDQGHIPVKLAGFEQAVNVTVGLPIVRTSVDHGTAFDIAGTGEASASSLIAATRYALRLAAGKHSLSESV